MKNGPCNNKYTDFWEEEVGKDKTGVIQKRSHRLRMRREPLSVILQRGGLLVLDGSASGKSVHQTEQKFIEILVCANLARNSLMNKTNVVPAPLELLV